LASPEAQLRSLVTLNFQLTTLLGW